MLRWRNIVSGLLLTVTLAGCGGQTSSSDSRPTPTSPTNTPTSSSITSTTRSKPTTTARSAPTSPPTTTTTTNTGADPNSPVAECVNRSGGTPGEVYERTVTTDGPPEVNRYGGGWAWNFGDRKCMNSVDWLLSGNPSLPGFCSQVALVSDNPNYDEKARPAPQLKKVLGASGNC